MKNWLLFLFLIASIATINSSVDGFARRAALTNYLSHYYPHIKQLIKGFSQPFSYLWNLPRAVKFKAAKIGTLGLATSYLLKSLLINTCLSKIEATISVLGSYLANNTPIPLSVIIINNIPEYYFSNSQLTKLEELKKALPALFYWPSYETNFPDTSPSGEPTYKKGLYVKEQLRTGFNKKNSAAYQAYLKNEASIFPKLHAKGKAALQKLEEYFNNVLPENKKREASKMKEILETVETTSERYFDLHDLRRKEDLERNVNYYSTIKMIKDSQ